MKMLRVINKTENQKLANKAYCGRDETVTATYRPVGETCPQDCPFLNNGCYAQGGYVRFTERRALNHADELASIKGDLVRHHVSGDLFTDDKLDIEYLKSIIRFHCENPDKTGWLFTHRIADLVKAGYGAVNFPRNLTVIASVDGIEDIIMAQVGGFKTARVTDDWDDRRPGEAKCLYQTTYEKHIPTNKTAPDFKERFAAGIARVIPCKDCRLCFDPKFKNVNILFKRHS